MPIPKPKSIEFLPKLNDIRQNGTFINKHNNLVYFNLERDINAHMSINAAEGWTFRGMLASCTGNREEADNCLKKAMRLPVNNTIIRNILVTYSGLNMHREMAEVFRKYAQPERGYFTELVFFGISSGAIRTAAEYTQRAKEIGIDLSGNPLQELTERIQSAAKILAKHDVDESYVTDWLDLAGQIFFENKRFFAPLIMPFINEIDEWITLRLIIKGTAKEAFELNKALAQKEIESGMEKMPGVDILFSASNVL